MRGMRRDLVSPGSPRARWGSLPLCALRSCHALCSNFSCCLPAACPPPLPCLQALSLRLNPATAALVAATEIQGDHERGKACGLRVKPHGVVFKHVVQPMSTASGAPAARRARKEQVD